MVEATKVLSFLELNKKTEKKNYFFCVYLMYSSARRRRYWP